MCTCGLSAEYQRWFWIWILFTLISQVSTDVYYHQYDDGAGESGEIYLREQNENRCYAKNSLRTSNALSVQKLVDIYNPLVYAAAGIYLMLLTIQEK